MWSASEVKQGDPVVFVKDGKEYNAIAQSNASLGYHPGAKLSNFHLSLVYLDEKGVPVQVKHAPLVTAAAGKEELAQIARTEFNVRSRGPHRDQLTTLDDLTDELAKRPIVAGWRHALPLPEQIPTGTPVVSGADETLETAAGQEEPQGYLVGFQSLIDLSMRIAKHATNLEISPDAVVPNAIVLIDSLAKERDELGNQLANMKIEALEANGQHEEDQLKIDRLKKQVARGISDAGTVDLSPTPAPEVVHTADEQNQAVAEKVDEASGGTENSPAPEDAENQQPVE